MSAEYRVYSPFPLCDWHECLRALGVVIFDGKGGTTPYDPSRHYIEETGRALKAWVVKDCCGDDESKYRAAGAAIGLRMALCQVDAMITWLRFHGKDGLADTVEKAAGELLEKCAFFRYKGLGPKADAHDKKDDLAFDKVKLELLMMANAFQAELKRILVLIGVSKGAGAVTPLKVAVITAAFKVSACTLRRAVREEKLRDCRPAEKQGTNCPMLLNPVEVARHWPPRVRV
jgi:hypothetical protein